MAWSMGGKVAACDKREYGRAQLQIQDQQSALFKGLGEATEVNLYIYVISRIK